MWKSERIWITNSDDYLPSIPGPWPGVRSQTSHHWRQQKCRIFKYIHSTSYNALLLEWRTGFFSFFAFFSLEAFSFQSFIRCCSESHCKISSIETDVIISILAQTHDTAANHRLQSPYPSKGGSLRLGGRKRTENITYIIGKFRTYQEIVHWLTFLENSHRIFDWVPLVWHKTASFGRYPKSIESYRWHLLEIVHMSVSKGLWPERSQPIFNDNLGDGAMPGNRRLLGSGQFPTRNPRLFARNRPIQADILSTFLGSLGQFPALNEISHFRNDGHTPGFILKWADFEPKSPEQSRK